jgi:hypothetical protein
MYSSLQYEVVAFARRSPRKLGGEGTGIFRGTRDWPAPSVGSVTSAGPRSQFQLGSRPPLCEDTVCRRTYSITLRFKGTYSSRGTVRRLSVGGENNRVS